MTAAVLCSPHTFNNHVSPYMARSFTLDSNSAGAPLPRIPRRTPPSSRTPSSNGVPRSAAVSAAAATLQNLFRSPTATVVVEPPSPPNGNPANPASYEDAVASSSSSSESSYVEFGVKTRKGRPRKIDLLPPEQCTPIPALHHARTKNGVVFPQKKSSPVDDDTPRPNHSLRSASFGHTSSGISIDDLTASPSSQTLSTPTSSLLLGRRKPGEPLKSSLKSRRPVVRGDLTVVTSALSSKSEPTTPTGAKSVHFDSREHVKLFLAEQKPLAVSRDGSPTDDTSGTESDFPSFIYGGLSDDERTRRSLAIEVVNFPAMISPAADVALESLTLSEDRSAINGRVRVRNISFEKWIAVRFTFDWWQTTSEVTAKYMESLPDGKFDRFGFSIRLSDMLKRIEEKTMFLAVRYSVVGKEMWDNNDGHNYQVKFKKHQQPQQQPSQQQTSPSAPAPTSAPMQSPVQATQQTKTAIVDSKMAVLSKKLEQVVKSQETVGGALTASRRGASSFPSSSPGASDTFSIKSTIPLSGRYNFAMSLKKPWKSSSSSSSSSTSGFVDHQRGSTYPNSVNMPATPPFTRSHFFDRRSFVTDPRLLNRGSPRIADDIDVAPPSHRTALTTPPPHPTTSSSSATSTIPFATSTDTTPGSDGEETPVPVMSRRGRPRNHSRGYFDLGMPATGGSVRRTPPGTPRTEPVRFNSFPPTTSPIGTPGVEHAAPHWHIRGRGDDVDVDVEELGMQMEGEPEGMEGEGEGAGSEDSTPSFSSTSGESSQSSEDSSPITSPVDLPVFYEIGSPVESPNYHDLLSRFCFFTGGDDYHLSVPPAEPIHRSHSASSVEELLSGSPNPNTHNPNSPSSPSSTTNTTMAGYRLEASQTPTRSSSYDNVAMMTTATSGNVTPTPSVALRRGTGVFQSDGGC